MSTDTQTSEKHLPLKVKRKLLKVDRVVGEDTVHEAVEAEIQLPFKVIKVYDVIANVLPVQAEVIQGGVQVSGVIDKQLFVVDRGDLVRHIPEEVPFSVFVPIQDAEPQMNVQVDVRVLSVDTNLVDPMTVRQVILLEIFVKVTVTKQIRVVVDVWGWGIEVEKEKLKVDAVVGEDRVKQPFDSTVTLPITAKKIFRIMPSVRDVTAEVRQGVVIVRGVIHKQIFLVDEGDLMRHAAEDIPFTKTIPIDKAEPGMQVQVNVSVKVDNFQLIDPPSRQLRQDLILDIFVKVTKILQIEVVTDVIGKGIKTKKKLLKVENVIRDLLQGETVQANVTLPVQAIKVFEVIGQLVNVEGVAGLDTVTIKGILHKQLFYVDPSNLVRHVREDIPFRFVKDAPGVKPGMNVQVRAQIIGDIMARLINDKRVDQKAVIEFFIKVTKTVQLDVVVKVWRKWFRGDVEEVEEAEVIDEE